MTREASVDDCPPKSGARPQAGSSSRVLLPARVVSQLANFLAGAVSVAVVILAILEATKKNVANELGEKPDTPIVVDTVEEPYAVVVPTVAIPDHLVEVASMLAPHKSEEFARSALENSEVARTLVEQAESLVDADTFIQATRVYMGDRLLQEKYKEWNDFLTKKQGPKIRDMQASISRALFLLQQSLDTNKADKLCNIIKEEIALRGSTIDQLGDWLGLEKGGAWFRGFRERFVNTTKLMFPLLSEETLLVRTEEAKVLREGSAHVYSALLLSTKGEKEKTWYHSTNLKIDQLFEAFSMLNTELAAKEGEKRAAQLDLTTHEMIVKVSNDTADFRKKNCAGQLKDYERRKQQIEEAIAQERNKESSNKQKRIFLLVREWEHNPALIQRRLLVEFPMELEKLNESIEAATSCVENAMTDKQLREALVEKVAAEKRVEELDGEIQVLRKGKPELRDKNVSSFFESTGEVRVLETLKSYGTEKLVDHATELQEQIQSRLGEGNFSSVTDWSTDRKQMAYLVQAMERQFKLVGLGRSGEQSVSSVEALRLELTEYLWRVSSARSLYEIERVVKGMRATIYRNRFNEQFLTEISSTQFAERLAGRIVFNAGDEIGTQVETGRTVPDGNYIEATIAG
ncbi:expressed unknown protein [Seminavis robusta]|uniref:Uncharacterized protein n=1 Tax=Seminavis robusta TaxID=568900 RepID=A0A9N8H894_9STRA|nr:expressed unknown protein [Seminavis robusta]|eukprot:Sro85_g045390.1 n/a (632) ;mRNA; r:70319-72214